MGSKNSGRAAATHKWEVSRNPNVPYGPLLQKRVSHLAKSTSMPQITKSHPTFALKCQPVFKLKNQMGNFQVKEPFSCTHLGFGNAHEFGSLTYDRIMIEVGFTNLAFSNISQSPGLLRLQRPGFGFGHRGLEYDSSIKHQVCLS